MSLMYVLPLLAAMSSLIVCSQTELSITTHLVVSDMHQNLMDIHRAVVVKQEGNDGKTSLVGVTCLFFMLNQHSPLPRPKPGQ